MARALAAVGAALVFLLLVLGVVVYLNRDEDAIAVDNLLAENISREIGTAETERRTAARAADHEGRARRRDGEHAEHGR